MTVIIALAVFATVAALVLALNYREQERASFSKARIERATGQAPALPFGTAVTGGIGLRVNRLSSSETIDRALRGLRLADKINQKLNRSDWKLKVSDFLLISGALGIIVFGIAAYLSGSLLVGVVVGIPPIFLPYFLLNRSVNKRRKRFNVQLVEVLSQMSNSLKAGFGLLQAIAQAADEADHPIQTELRRFIYDVQVGANVEDAFNDLAERVRSEDLDIVITAILIQRGAGGSLAEILENVTHTMRERIRIRGEIETLTSQQRLTGYLIAGLPIALFALFFFINRPYISLLLTTTFGHLMLGAWAVLQGIGYFAIRRILNIEL